MAMHQMERSQLETCTAVIGSRLHMSPNSMCSTFSAAALCR